MQTINELKENKRILREWIRSNKKIKNKFRITIIDNKTLIFDIVYNNIYNKRNKIIIRYFNFLFKKFNIKYGSKFLVCFCHYKNFERFYIYLDEINHYKMQAILKSIEKAGKYIGVI